MYVPKMGVEGTNALDHYFWLTDPHDTFHIYGSVQDCIICSANAQEILQSCTKPLICSIHIHA